MSTDLTAHDPRPPATSDGRMLAVLSYVSLFVGLPLFIIPLAQKKDPFAMFHARHAGALFVLSLVEGFALGMIIVLTCGLGFLLLPILFLPWVGAGHGILLALSDAYTAPVLTFGLGEKWFGSIQPQ